MLRLVIDGGLSAIALGLLINSRQMDHTAYKAGKSILINRADYEAADKILERNMIPYRGIGMKVA